MKIYTKKFTKLAFELLILIVLFPGCSNTPTPTIAPPNIVWITSEDNSKHYLELFDENGVSTPNIEKLAENGITYTRAFSNSPVCSGARSTLISGCYGPRTASHYHRKIKKSTLPESVKMFPYYLRKAGYYTSNNAKEDYNFIKSDSVWDESSNNASWRNRKNGQPFFHVQNIYNTHEGRMHFSADDLKNNPTLTNPDSCFVQPNHPNTNLFKYTNAYYRDKIISMDSIVGKVINMLENDSLLENTIVFYFGDHGGVLPDSKGYLTETGLHVPLVVYVPKKYQHLTNLKPSSKTNNFVSFVDFGATVLHLAGIKIPEGIDGKPFIGNSEIQVNNETYSYADRFDEKYDMVRALRKGKFKYIRNYQPFYYDGLFNAYRYKQLAYQQWYSMYLKGELNDIQSSFFETKLPEALYDIENDPFETTNLATDTSYLTVLTELRGKVYNWQSEMPDLSFYPEYYLIENALDNPIAFGEKHKLDIKRYIDIANLILLNYREVAPKISDLLKSTDSWERYWALTVCCSFREQALDLAHEIAAIAKTDSITANQVRAAEFLGITQMADPSFIMENALYKAKNEAEALLVLNAMVLMKDKYNYSFSISLKNILPDIVNNTDVKNRLEYISPNSLL